MKEPYCSPSPANPSGPQGTGKRMSQPGWRRRLNLPLTILCALIALAALLVYDAPLAEAQSSQIVTVSFWPKTSFNVPEGGTVEIPVVLDRAADFPITVTLIDDIPACGTIREASSTDYALEGATFTIPSGQKRPDVNPRVRTFADSETDDSEIIQLCITLPYKPDGAQVAPDPAKVTIVAPNNKAPAAPTSQRVQAAGKGLIVTWWARDEDNVVTYDVEYKESTATNWTDTGHSGAATTQDESGLNVVTTIIPGLTTGTSYDVRARVRNADGTSPWAKTQGTPLGTPSIGFKDTWFQVSEGATAEITINIAPVMARNDIAVLRALTGDRQHTAQAADYDLPGIVMLPAGAATVTFQVPLKDDNHVENYETLVMGLEGVTYNDGPLYTVDTNRNRARIQIKETQYATLSFGRTTETIDYSPVSRVAEGGTVGLKVQLDRPAEFPITVALTSNADTDPNTSDATENTDYVLEAATFTIPPGSTEPAVQPRVRTIADSANDDGERLQVNITVPGRPDLVQVAPDPALVIIGAQSTDTPSAPAGLTVTAGYRKLALAWIGPSETVTGYDVEYKESTASTWLDAGHSGASPSHTISGLTAGTAYDLRVRAVNTGLGDSNKENGPWATGSGTPVPTVSLSASPNPVTEGSAVTITVRLSSPLSHYVTIPLSVTAGSAETGDFGSLAGITINSGETVGTGTIATNRDADGEDETFTVELGSSLPPTVETGNPESVTVVITEDEGYSFSRGEDPLNANLSGLTVTHAAGATNTFTPLPLDAPFRPGLIYYGAAVDNAVSHVKLTPTAENSEATVKVGKEGSLASVTGGTASDAIALDVGENVIIARVTPEKQTGPERSYFVTVTRAAPPLPAAPMGLAIQVDGAEITLAWTPPAGAVTGYDVEYKAASASSWTDAFHTGADASLTITGLNHSTAYDVRVRAVNGNGHGPWAQSQAVTADGGTEKTSPALSLPLPDLTGLEAGETRDISLDGVFTDADGDSLTITATSSDQAIATAAVNADQSRLTVAGAAQGDATITVTAQDPDGNRVSDGFTVSVEPAPDAPEPVSPGGALTVAQPLADISLKGPMPREISLAGVFHDPDGDGLTITTTSSNYPVATMWVSSDYLTLTVVGLSTGTATITVTAQDNGGNRVSDQFEVSVSPNS